MLVSVGNLCMESWVIFFATIYKSNQDERTDDDNKE